MAARLMQLLRHRHAEIIPLLFILVGIFIRFISLNQSLWLDEGVTARIATTIPFSRIIPAFSVFDFHPPLYYFAIKTWVMVFGFSELALRMPSVIASICSAFVLYLIVKHKYNYSTTLWAVAFLLLNPLFLYYSQEARMYAFVAFSSLLFVYGMVAKKYVWGVLGLVFSVFLFYGSILFLVSCFLYLLYARRFKEFTIYLLLVTICIVILSPLLLLQLQNARSVLKNISGWKSVLGVVTAKNLFLIPLKFVTGRISFEPKIAYYLLGLFSVFIIFFGAMRGFLKEKMFLFIVFCLLFLAIAVSFVTPMLQYFRYLYLVPLIMAACAIGYKNTFMRITVALVLLSWSLAYVLLPQFHREDWKSLANSLPKNAVVYGIPSSLDALRFYNSQIRILDFSKIENSKIGKFLVIPYTFEIYGIQTNSLKTIATFRGGLSVASYSKVRDNKDL